MEGLKRALVNGDIKPETFKAYVDRLHRIKRIADMSDISLIFTSPPSVSIDCVRLLDSAHSRRNCASAVRAAVTWWWPPLPPSQEATDYYDEWSDYHKEVDLEVDYNAAHGIRPAADMDAMIPWEEEAMVKRDAMVDKDGQPYLVVCMYTMIPPVRADFPDCRILRDEPVDEDRKLGNYMVVTKHRPRYIRLVINEWKTEPKSKPKSAADLDDPEDDANKVVIQQKGGRRARVERYDRILPKQLEAVIRRSLEDQPRRFLFTPRPWRTNTNCLGKDDKPFIDGKAFGTWANNVFKKHIGKGITITVLRRMYIKYKDNVGMNAAQEEELADAMLHSTSMQRRYLSEPITKEVEPLFEPYFAPHSLKALKARSKGKKKRV